MGGGGQVFKNWQTCFHVKNSAFTVKKKKKKKIRVGGGALGIVPPLDPTPLHINEVVCLLCIQQETVIRKVTWLMQWFII